MLRKIYLLIPIAAIIFFLAINLSPIRSAIYAIIVAVIIGMIQPGPNRLTIRGLFEALENGARSAIGVAIACTAAGIIVGVILLTGIGLKVANGLVDLAGGNVFLTLVMTMVASLILGMWEPLLRPIMSSHPPSLHPLSFI
ncbi:TRAP transporter large permease subunit [Thermicanus aegyptius]|uniref:TRAP transporter large permease subunit n=1 Tax=Thermicanus aegyptius TaxID=94009 RepID=UPI00041CC583|nr:TRAP transporter large permease subunit [Thermicanus aegyptius]